jgi:hypothetical protein
MSQIVLQKSVAPQKNSEPFCCRLAKRRSMIGGLGQSLGERGDTATTLHGFRSTVSIWAQDNRT